MLLTLSAMLLVPMFALHAAKGPAARPNVIFIMADDLGYTDVACYGSKYYETPNIDRLASQGMKLVNYHHCQNCAPTRAALMSGQYGARTGVYTVGATDRFDWSRRPLRPVDNVTNLPLDRDIIAKQIKAAGYATGMFGKWHIGEQGDYHPGKRGFDEAIASQGKHFDFATNPKTEYPKGQYLADFLTNKAVDFITRHKDQPFFLYLPHFAVHGPHDAKAELVAKFKPKPGVGGHDDPTYAAMIYSVDESVGRVMKTLEDLKLADNTVLIFTSDNGGVGGYVREGIKKGGDVTDNAPLRSGKGSLHEGGTRVPFIVRWPGVTRPGSTCNTPAIHVDVFPTMLELTGAPAPRQVLDGESLVKLFRDPDAKLHRDAIYQHFPGYLGAGEDKWRTTPVSLVQVGDWKLMEFLEDKRLELYNLSEDIGEAKNLAKEMPEKADELLARLRAWREEVKAPMPTKNDGKTAQPKAKKGKQKAKGKRKKKAASATPIAESGEYAGSIFGGEGIPGSKLSACYVFQFDTYEGKFNKATRRPLFAILWKAEGGAGSKTSDGRNLTKSIHEHAITPSTSKKAVYALQPDYSLEPLSLTEKEIDRLFSIASRKADEKGSSLFDDPAWKEKVEPHLKVAEPPEKEAD